MTTTDYSLSEDMGLLVNGGLEDFWLKGKDGDTIDVTIESDGRVVPLTLVDKVKDKYGRVHHDGEYSGETAVYAIVSCDNVLYIAGMDGDDLYGDWDEDDVPNEFFPIQGYSIDPLAKKLTAKRIGSLRDQDVEVVDAFEPGSKFGGWPVNALGERMKSWPHFEGHPLVFQAQHELPDGRMMWVFANGVEALQTVLPIEKDPDWTAELHYVKGMTGKELFDIHDKLYNRDKWHYENRKFLGQKRPITVMFENWKWENNGIAVIVEGEGVPSWIEMKKVLPEMLPFLTVSERAVSFPAGIHHAPKWVQCEPHEKNYECRKFLFQIDDGVGGIDFDYGDMGTLYVYWNGKNAGVGLIQCY